jgi:hypothetical protein
MAGRICKLKKINDIIGTRTSYLLACSITPQPSTLPRAPTQIYSRQNIYQFAYFNSMLRHYSLLHVWYVCTTASVV